MTLPADWFDPVYLATGTARQRAAHRALQALDLFGALRAYTPMLCGTIPLDLDIDGSDLDIICEAHDLAAFARDVRAAFASCTGFDLRQETVQGVPTVSANFEFEGFAFEIFGQPHAVEEQNAYRHMVVEARLLEMGGEAARAKIRALKKAGLKTEPAFASYLGLTGDPYGALLKLYGLTGTEMRRSLTHYQPS